MAQDAKSINLDSRIVEWMVNYMVKLQNMTDFQTHSVEARVARLFFS